jgi:hypothetical protein
MKKKAANNSKLDIHVSMQNDTIYENDQQDATV